MKVKVLTVAAIFVGLATAAGLLTVFFGEPGAAMARGFSAGGVLGLGSIGLFFVGLALPKNN